MYHMSKSEVCQRFFVAYPSDSCKLLFHLRFKHNRALLTGTGSAQSLLIYRNFCYIMYHILALRMPRFRVRT
jgi:hypothetical protein